MEPQECEGTRGPSRQTESLGERGRLVLLLIHQRRQRLCKGDQLMTKAALCHFLLDRSQWDGVTGIHGLEAHGHFILTFLPLSSSTSPTTLPSSRWKSSGKYLASDTISSLQ